MLFRRHFLIGALLSIATVLKLAIARVSAQSNKSKSEILQDLTQVSIIFLGERHDNAMDHQEQLAILQALHRKNPKIAIAFEMFQRPYQFALDEYLAGTISEDQLQEKTEYRDRWGFDWNYYAPILRFAQRYRLPLIALNTPTEITRKVAVRGLSSLTPEEQRWIPPIADIITDDPDYRRYLNQIYQQHQHGAQGNSQNFDRFVEAQVLWDETMAEAIAKFARTHPDYQILVLAGRGHILYGYGIPRRVQRRLGAVTMRSVFFGEEFEESKSDRKPSDYQWIP